MATNTQFQCVFHVKNEETIQETFALTEYKLMTSNVLFFRVFEEQRMLSTDLDLVHLFWSLRETTDTVLSPCACQGHIISQVSFEKARKKLCY